MDEATFECLYVQVEEVGLPIASREHVRARLDELRSRYERHAQALGRQLALGLPKWAPEDAPRLAEPVHSLRRL